MASELFAVLVAWLMTVLAKVTDLKATEPPKRRIALSLILLSSSATMFSVWVVVDHHSRKQIDLPDNEDRARLQQEASGGAMLGEDVLLVDDEVPAIMRLELDGNGDLNLMEHLWLYEDGHRLDHKEVDDLEGLAVSPDGDFIYAMTSHSFTKKEEDQDQRRFLLRVCIPKVDGVPVPRKVIVLDKLSLFEAFSAAIFEKGIAHPFTLPARDDWGAPGVPMRVEMEIEGLAAGRDGNLYFGFRAPLSAEYGNALIARIPTEILFPGARPECRQRVVPRTRVDPRRIEVRQMPLHEDGQDYGVVSMEFDASGELVMLANSPRPFRYLPPMVCRWNPAKRPSTRHCTILPETAEPYHGKLEGLILGPGPASATIFIDGDKGLGGRITYDRTELGL